jgi:hypothetical protein
MASGQITGRHVRNAKTHNGHGVRDDPGIDTGYSGVALQSIIFRSPNVGRPI